MTIHLHTRLRQLRKDKPLTQQKIADMLGVPRVTYTHYELGLRTPDLALLMQIADIHQVTLDFLIGYTDRKPTPEAWAADHPKTCTDKGSESVYQLDAGLAAGVSRVADAADRDKTTDSITVQNRARSDT